MNEAKITHNQIDDLLRFLPTLGAAGPSTVVETNEHAPYPTYTAEVREFFRIAGMPWWSSWYGLQETRAMVRNDEAIQSATLDEIRSMQTFCVRGERLVMVSGVLWFARDALEPSFGGSQN